MNKISVIILREFTTRILKKSFIILTILMPFLMAGIVAVPFLLGQLEDDKESTIAVIDQTGLYRDCLKSNERYHYVFLDHMTPELRSDTSDITAVLQISDDLTQSSLAWLDQRNPAQPDGICREPAGGKGAARQVGGIQHS